MSPRSEKFERQIEALETALRDRLLRLLPEAVESGAYLFTNSEFNPSGLHRFHPDAEELLQQAHECVRLREQIDLSVLGSVGHLFIAICEEHASRDPHARGNRRLAETLLMQLREASR